MEADRIVRRVRVRIRLGYVSGPSPVIFFTNEFEMKNIRLYLCGMLADIQASVDSEFDFPLNWTMEDFSEPTAIRNTWTNSVTLKGTKRNNEIFGHIYLDDRTVDPDAMGIMADFNPNRRVDYRLYIDDILEQTGYMQLNKVREENGLVEYDCTFYGGIGDFFYTLATDDVTGETRKLSDLHWGVRDKDGRELPAETEFSFRINKDFIYENWNCLEEGKDDGTVHSFISFAPAYNGLTDTDGNNRVLCNSAGSELFKEEADKAQKPYNGWYMARYDDSVDEWGSRDLRSYMQRPAVRVSKLFGAIARKENNGGYELRFDDTFFNDGNPYWKDAFILLPKMKKDEEGSSDSLYTTQIKRNQKILLGGLNFPVETTADVAVEKSAGIGYADGVIDLSQIEQRYKASMTMKFSLDFELTDPSATDRETLDMDLGDVFINTGNGETNPHSTAILLSLDCYDADTNKIIFSSNKRMISTGPCYQLTNLYPKVISTFRRQADGTYKFGSQIEVAVGIPAAPERIRMVCSAVKAATPLDKPTDGLGYVETNVGDDQETRVVWLDGKFTLSFDSGELSVPKSTGMGTDVTVTKDMLFNAKDNTSVLDFVLGYTKKMGLVWVKDELSREISLMSRNRFYQEGKRKAIDGYIDLTKGRTMTPLLFDSRFYLFRDLECDDYYSSLYRDKYGKEYGQQRVDTGYPFNSDTNDNNADNIYAAMPEACPVASQNCSWYAGDERLGSWAGSIRNKLTTYVDGEVRSFDFPLSSRMTTRVWYSKDIGRDWTHRPASVSDNNRAGSTDYSLVFYTGMERASDTDGALPFWITDDLDEMYIIADGKTLIYTQSEFDVNKKRIAYKVTEIPHFSRWKMTGNRIEWSWDWGKPVELFVNDVICPEDTGLYGRFWKEYIRDQYNVNARQLTVYVDLRKVQMNGLFLGNIFCFGGSQWVLNSVEEYDLTKNQPVKCVFVRVNNLTAYTNGQHWN